MPTVLLDATREADLVTVPARTVLAYEGQGAPEGEAFQRAFPALYGIAFTLKFARKAAGGHEFKIGPIEGRWWAAADNTPFGEAPRDSWRWRLRIALPDDVAGPEIAAAIRTATTKKGGKLEGSADAKRVFLERIPAQRVGRALHVGPYGEEERTLRAIDEALARAGVTPAFSHLEIYLGDPRRTPPARLRTVLVRETR